MGLVYLATCMVGFDAKCIGKDTIPLHPMGYFHHLYRNLVKQQMGWMVFEPTFCQFLDKKPSYHFFWQCYQLNTLSR